MVLLEWWEFSCYADCKLCQLNTLKMVKETSELKTKQILVKEKRSKSTTTATYNQTFKKQK